MKRLSGSLLAVLLSVGCSHERAASPTAPVKTPASETPAAEASGGEGTSEAPERAVDERAGEGDVPASDPAEKKPAAPGQNEQKKNPVPVEGERQLLALATGAVAAGPVSLGAFDVACLASPAALTAPEEAAKQLAREAETQGVSLGQLLLVRIERDPTTGNRDPRPRVCRPVAEDAELYAPLFREKKRAGAWAVARFGGDLKADLRRLVGKAREAKGAPASRPYALVVEDQVVLLALPLEESGLDGSLPREERAPLEGRP